jgi:hypothetical protein
LRFGNADSFGHADTAAIERAFAEQRVPLTVMSIADPTTAELYESTACCWCGPTGT